MVSLTTLLRHYLCLVVCFGQFGFRPLAAQQFATEGYTIRHADGPITLDGLLTEPAWQVAQVAGNFWQVFPSDTVRALSRTEVRMTHDRHALYIGAICHDDTLPGKYVVQSLRRDFSYPASDAFAVYLDPTADQTNGFNFTVSPLGAEREGVLEDGGRFGVTTSWDIKWRVKVKRYPNRWVVEMAIPFKSLRYRANGGSWRVNFSRNNYKINENTAWVRVPIQFNVATMAYMAQLEWETQPPRPGLNANFIPYVTGGAADNYTDALPERYDLNAGLDAKIAVTPSLNLDLTANPDFSQVEVDRQVTNLDRFELFFPERRLFFIENSDLFARFGFSRIRPFFSRRIGLANAPGQPGPVAVPILAGARLSGKTGQDWRVGAMSLQTEGVAEHLLVPQNYSVAAVQRRVRQRSNIGAIFVNRQGFRPNPNHQDFSRIAGIDYNLFSNDTRWQGKMFYHQSFKPGQAGDAMAQAVWLRYQTRNWRIDYNHEYIGKNYSADVGFVPRRGVVRFEPGIRYWFFAKPRSFVIKHGPHIYNDQYRDTDLRMLDYILRFTYSFIFRNTASLEISFTENHIKLTSPFDPTNTRGERLPVGGYGFRTGALDFNTNLRAKLYAVGSVEYGSYFNGLRLRYRGELTWRLQPYANLRVAYEQNQIALPAPFATTNLTLFSPEAELTLRPNLFFTVFTQYNTQINNMNINARFQWRFKPMSDLFIVWTENYFTETLGIRDRAVMLKVNWWLGL